MIGDDEDDRYPWLPGFVTGSETSEAAADSIAPDIPKLNRIVLDALIRRGKYGATDEELLDELQWRENTCRPRRVELMHKGLVRDSGRKRFTTSRRLAVVWVVTEAR